jgi:hypothetical protein
VALPQLTRAQQVDNPAKKLVESELVLEGGGSVGHYSVVAYSQAREVYTTGLEYDRHSWGSFLGARLDYVAELLPAVFLTEPARYDSAGIALTTDRKVTFGTGISATGVRLLWRRDKTFKPFLIAKGGIVYFTNRVISTEGGHLNFSSQFGTGLETRLSPHWDLRTGFTYFHLSDGNLAPKNPGVDFMYFAGGVGYRFGGR